MNFTLRTEAEWDGTSYAVETSFSFDPGDRRAGVEETLDAQLDCHRQALLTAAGYPAERPHPCKTCGDVS